MKPFALLAVLMLWSASAQAQTTPPPAAPAQLDTRGTAEDQKACDRDAQRHCREVLSGGDFAVLGCLRENRTKLSRACQGVLTKYGQ
jgi:Cysteine rich repeat